MLIDAIHNASQELMALLIELSETFPGAVAYVTEPGVAASLQLSVAAEGEGLAVGLLSPDEGARHLPYWEARLEQRVRVDERNRTDRLPIPPRTASVLILFDQGEYVWGQWMRVIQYRSVN
ncbi:hypothetical protein [Rubrivirga sp.]|uniref:hypothetical protein n=1 Tax=Rubrivirga sp. TaxID=1885344 RepID=UPI003B516ECF